MLIYSISYPRLCGQKMQWVFFLYKPRQKMVIIFSSSYKYRLSGYTTSNDNKKHSFDTLFFTFPPSFTQFTSSWPHRQFFLFFLWSLCAVLSLLDWKTPKQLNDQRSHTLPHLRQILVNYKQPLIYLHVCWIWTVLEQKLNFNHIHKGKINPIVN